MQPLVMPSTDQTDFTCAFCGLACDDVRVGVAGAALQVTAQGCPISERALNALSAVSAEQVRPRVNGAAASLSDAVSAAAEILRKAPQPLLAGLGTDVGGARAAMRLAERCGAVTDHMNFTAKMRNVLTVQDRGWITTTFAEVKNRADLIVVLGSDIGARFPRFFERLVAPADAMFVASKDVVYLGDAANAASCRAALPTTKMEVIACANEQLAEVLGVLRMLVSEHPACAGLHPLQAAGVELGRLRQLAARLKAAKYAVFVWAAADFDFAHAELTLQRGVELVKDLNKTTRCAGLPLGGNDGDLSVNQVHVWQSGFALRSDFGRGHADYDPYNNAATRLLERGEADALLWISSFNEARLPPPAPIPTVVLGRPDMAFEREPEVFIPVGTPGVDHAGHFVRSDKVVTMRLGKLRESMLPTVAQVLGQIEAVL